MIVPFLPFFLAVAGDVVMFAMRAAAAREGVLPPTGGISNLAMLFFSAFVALSVVFFKMLGRGTRGVSPATPAMA